MTGRRYPSAAKWLLLILSGGVSVILVALWYVDSARAESVVHVSAQTLEFRSRVNESLQRTFTLVVHGDPITEVQVVHNDLVDSHTKAVLLSDKVSVAPMPGNSLATGPHRFTVTVSAGQRAGHYVGTIEIRYAGLPPTQPLIITLDVTLEAIPAVDVEVNSKNLLLPLSPTWDSFPWNKPTNDTKSPQLGEIIVSLLQNAEGVTRIEGAEILAMHGAKGHILPAHTLQVPTAFPITLTNADATSLRIVAAGNNLRPDEYKGTLFIKVHNQPNAIQLPLKVQVKDGPILAIVCLLLGPIIGFLVRWGNSGGLARNRLRKRIDTLHKTLGSGAYLPRDKQRGLEALLNEAKQAMVNGKQVDEITQKIEAMSTAFNTAQTEARQFVTGQIEPLRVSIAGLEPGQTYRQKLLDDLEKIRLAVVNGTVASLQEASQAFKDTQTKAADFEAALKTYEGLDPAVQNAWRKALDEAPSIAAIKQIVAEATKAQPSGGPAPIFGSYAGGGPGSLEAEVALTQAEQDWERERLKLRVGALAVTILLYIFVLVVGFVVFYMPSPTFGSDPEVYITLLLWGAASNLIGVQTVDLKQI